MMRFLLITLFCVSLAGSASSQSDGRHDRQLRRVVLEFNLRPLATKPFEVTNKFTLGQALFFDPLLSGNRDVACATCHLLQYGMSDGLAFSIGTKGRGLGPQRVSPEGRPQQPRNALALWNRDNNWVRSMFWDGRVEALGQGLFRSPLGSALPGGFDNVMAVQSVFPLAQKDEMLGLAGDRSAPDLPELHRDRLNEFATQTDGLASAERILRVAQLVLRRLLGTGTNPDQPWQVEYRKLFQAAYGAVATNDITIVHAANALAHFEEIAFATRDTSWDRYLGGDVTAISPTAKRGALAFFGKGRCVVCHQGPLFSDFNYHAIGVRNHGPGIDASGDDMGRYLVTGDPQHKYLFRTPPLRNVTLTAPYLHNGSATTLMDAIEQHLNPLRFADQYDETGAFAMNIDQIRAISPILLSRITLSDDETDAIVAFLKTLEGGLSDAERAIPDRVPSGLSVFHLP